MCARGCQGTASDRSPCWWELGPGGSQLHCDTGIWVYWFPMALQVPQTSRLEATQLYSLTVLVRLECSHGPTPGGWQGRFPREAPERSASLLQGREAPFLRQRSQRRTSASDSGSTSSAVVTSPSACLTKAFLIIVTSHSLAKQEAPLSKPFTPPAESDVREHAQLWEWTGSPWAFSACQPGKLCPRGRPASG